MLFYIQKFCYNNVSKAKCFMFESSFLAFHCNSGTFAEVRSFSSSCLSWESNVFPTLFHYEWLLWVCLKELGELVWKAFCSVRWIKFIAISAAKHLTTWVQMNQTLQTLQPTVFSLQTLPCVHQILLDGYFLFGIEENPLNTPNSALLRDYLFLFYFSR